MKNLFILTLALGLFCFSQSAVLAQDQPTQQPSTEDLEKQKAEREKNAYRLLDQIIDEAQSLRLVENRVRIQINAADMIWSQDQGRARTLFLQAADGVAELGRQPVTNNRRQVMPDGGGNFTVFAGPGGGGPANFRTYQLRQELVMAAARHDAPLAYQLLAATKPPANTQATTDPRNPRSQLNSDDNLEQMLLGRIAAIDPKLAAQNAELMMEKGQFPLSMPEVINQLYRQDADAGDKLADKTVKKLQASNILSKSESIALAQTFLRPGPRPVAQGTSSTANAQTATRAPLGQTAYVDLLSTVVDAALKATPPTSNNQQRGAPGAQRRVIAGGSGIGVAAAPQPQTEAQMEQANARRLLTGLQSLMPYVDQYVPSKAPLVRQKLSELGLSNNTAMNMAQTFSSLQGNPNSEALFQAANVAPQNMKPRLYQQAAYKALEEGNTDRARQIANDYLQNNARDAVMKRIDFREMAKKADSTRFEEIRQSVARLQTDNEKIDLLIQVAGDVQKDDQKLAVQVLEEARQLVNRRATSYEHFEQQLKVARAFSGIDPQRSFEVMDPGISQLNELLSAASVLNGFEVNMFRDGEMTIQGGSGLMATINRYGQELAVLARSDFERSETLAGRFQFAEPRIMTRLAIVQGLLGVRPSGPPRIGFALPPEMVRPE